MSPSLLQNLDELEAALTREGLDPDAFLDEVNDLREHLQRYARLEIALLDHVMDRKFSDDTILYFLEDDYLHRENWAETLLEAFTLPEADYVTLFDHRDKYEHEMYTDLRSRLFYTPSCHWRSTPSTTNTYAMRMKTLCEDIATHRKFSDGHNISLDHEKFLELGRQGKTLISSIPGWSTHCEPAFASPCNNWASLFLQESLK